MISVAVSAIHLSGVIHGDLTTSNIIVEANSDYEPKIYIIDFGLSFSSSSIEDRAVDLYVLERSLSISLSHICDKMENMFNLVLENYRKIMDDDKNIIKKYQQ
ncbi:hypothetical protein HZS_2994, partial [Henneguya salminicola]